MLSETLFNIYLTFAISYVFTCFAGYGFFVIYRKIVSKRPLLENKNYCEKCDKPFHNIYSYPIIGYFLCLGKCTNCNEKFGTTHLIIESLVFLTCFIIFSLGGFSLTAWILSSMYTIVALASYAHKCKISLKKHEILESQKL